jgi:Fe-S cluster biogenesis protein NfuA
MTPLDKILEVLDSIRPAIQADGGDVEFLAYREEEGVVEVRLMGACESCPISLMTLKEGIERRLRNSVPGIVEVTAV